MSEQSEAEELNASGSEGFGARLKKTRQEKKISIADVALQLRLDEDVIKALEEYDYAALPEPMFVCGYIRSYAKFLNLQPEPLIEFYKKNEVKGNLIPKLDVKNESRHVKSYSLGKFLPILFLLVIFGIVFAGWQWWQSQATQTDGGSAGSWFNFNTRSTDKESEPDSGEVDIMVDPDQLQLPEYIEQPLSEQPLLPQINETPPQVNETPPQVNETPPQVNETRVKRQAPAMEPSEHEPVSAGQQAVTQPPQIKQTQPEENRAPVESVESGAAAEAVAALNSMQNHPVSANILILDFTSDSWIRIRDADGNILAKDLKKKGSHLQLEGKRPYKVFLGDATGVTVRINNTIFDHSGYINEKKVARFEVK